MTEPADVVVQWDGTNTKVYERDEIERLQEQALKAREWFGFIEQLTEENKRLRALVQTLLDNDPNDMAADGVTVLEVWRKEARAALGQKEAAHVSNS